LGKGEFLVVLAAKLFGCPGHRVSSGFESIMEEPVGSS
jgi:hypothetical protein